MTSIYGEEWNVEDADSRNFSFNMIENDRDFSIYVHLPTNYPSEAPPTYDIMAPSLTKSEKDIIDNELNKVYL